MSQPNVTAVISAVDQASSVFQEFSRRMQLIGREMKDTFKDAGTSAIPENIRKAQAALDAHVRRIQGIKQAWKEAGQAAAAYAAIKLAHAEKEAIRAGAEYQSTRVSLKQAGIPDPEIRRTEVQVARLSAEVPQVTPAEGLELYKELRSVLKHAGEAPEMLPTFVRAKAVLDANDRSGNSSHGLGFLIKGMESVGIANDVHRVEGVLNSLVKAQQVMGKTINPEQLYETMKYTRTAGSQFSDKFWATTALSLAQEMGGSSAGVGLRQFVKQMVTTSGRGATQRAMAALDLGLLSEDDVVRNKQGDVKGFKQGRGIAGWDVALKDPFEWVQKVLMPALEKKGITDMHDPRIQGIMNKLFSDPTAADVVTKMLTQYSSFLNHAKLYQSALGIDGGLQVLKEDPVNQLKALTQAMENFGSAITSPLMKDTAGTLNAMAGWFADAAKTFSEWAKEHPIRAEIAGGGAVATAGVAAGALGYGGLQLVKKLLGVGALDASAAALTGAAIDLKLAAAMLKGAKGVGDIPGAAPVEAAKKAGIGTRIAEAAKAVAPTAALWGSRAVIAAGIAMGLYGLYEESSKPENAWKSLGERAKNHRGGKSVQEAIREQWNKERETLGLPALGAKVDPNSVATNEGVAKLVEASRQPGSGASAATNGTAGQPQQVSVAGEAQLQWNGSVEVGLKPEIVSMFQRAQMGLHGTDKTLGSSVPQGVGKATPEVAIPKM